MVFVKLPDGYHSNGRPRNWREAVVVGTSRDGHWITCQYLDSGDEVTVPHYTIPDEAVTVAP